MTESQAVEAISEAFAAGWTAAQPSIPYALDNEAMPSADSFVSFSIRHGASTQITQGPPGQRRWKRTLTIYTRIFVPVDQGRAAASALVGVVRTLLEGVSLGGTSSSGGEPVTMLATADREMGPVDSRWFAIACVTSGYYFETR